MFVATHNLALHDPEEIIDFLIFFLVGPQAFSSLIHPAITSASCQKHGKSTENFDACSRIARLGIHLDRIVPLLILSFRSILFQVRVANLVIRPIFNGRVLPCRFPSDGVLVMSGRFHLPSTWFDSHLPDFFIFLPRGLSRDGRKAFI